MVLLQSRLLIATLVALSIISMAHPAFSAHETVQVSWQNGVIVDGDGYRTTVQIVAGNQTGHGASGGTNSTRYLVVFKDHLISLPGMPVIVHNDTRTVEQFTNRSSVFTRQLTEGYWHLAVEVYDMATMRTVQVGSSEKTLVVQPAIYDLVENQSDAIAAQGSTIEQGFAGLQQAILIAGLAAIAAVLGAAAILARYSRRPEKEEPQSNQKDRDSVELADSFRDISALQERTATANQAAAESLRRSGESLVLMELSKSLSDVDFLRAKGRIFVVYCSVYGADQKGIDSKQELLLRYYASIKDDILRIETAFEQAAVLVLNDKVDRKIFFELHATAVIQTFQALEAHVKHERAKDPFFAQWYEKLCRLALDYYRDVRQREPPQIECGKRAG